MTATLQQQKKLNILLFILAALLFAYTSVRACLLSITWDEAYTYLEFVRNGKLMLHRYEGMSANDHLMNTWLMIFFTKVFGLSELVLRIPALLAHLLFLFYSAKLLKNLDNKGLVVAAFIILNVNPYVLDFFSLARGYGLSIGLMMASLYYFYRLHAGEKTHTSAILSVLFAGLAVLANFVLLNYCLVLFGLIVLLYLYKAAVISDTAAQKRNAIIKGLFLPTLLMLLLLLFVLPVLFQLKAAGALFFGGNRGFWPDTVCTITERCFYEVSGGKSLALFAKACMLLVLMAAAVVGVFTVIKKQWSINRLFLSSVFLLIVFSCLSTIVQHQVLKTLYLLDRTALFLVVLFNLLFVFLMAEVIKLKRWMAGIAYLYAAVAILLFGAAFNLHYVLEWKPDADTKQMLSDLGRLKKIPAGKQTLSIGIPLAFDPAINFYRAKNHLSWLNTVWRSETTNRLQDYFFLSEEELATVSKDSILILKTYPGTGNVLAKPKYPPTEIQTVFTREMNFATEPFARFAVGEEMDYPPGFSYTVTDTMAAAGKSAVLCFSATVMGPDPAKNNLVMVISFADRKHREYSWQKAYVKDFIRNRRDWFRADFTCIVPQKIQAGDEIKAYIWNPEKQLLYIKQMELKGLAYKYR